MTNKTGEKLPEYFDNFVEKFLMPRLLENINDEGGLMPVAFVGSTETKQVGIVAMAFQNVEEKDACSEVIKEIAQKFQADYVVFVSESWTVPSEHIEEFTNNRDKYPEVASFPKKSEVVMIMVDTKTSNWIGMCEIYKGRKLGKPKFMKSHSAEGRFSNFLPKVLVN